MLWNHVYRNTEKEQWKSLLRKAYGRFFLLPEDDAPEPITWYTGYNVSPCIKDLKGKFFNLQWHRVYDFIEFYIGVLLGFLPLDERKLKHEYKRQEKALNTILERQSSGYRMIEGEFAPITDATELGSVKNAIDSTSTPFENIRVQLKKAVAALSQKPNPDYRNSIKESISAVEGLCKMLTGEKSGGIDKAIRKLSKTIEMHEAMKQGFIKLYGYTSDEDGIRHPILEQSNVGLAEAKYMLVICSAFVNYVIMKTETGT